MSMKGMFWLFPDIFTSSRWLGAEDLQAESDRSVQDNMG